MLTILVPTDFSATAINSGKYAANLAKNIGAHKIVLYNAYSMPLATEMSWAFLQTEEVQKASEESLATLKADMQSWTDNSIEIDAISDFGFLQERISDIATEVKADLIVMGITGGGKLEEVFIGSNTTHIINHVKVPVLIVPPDASWKPVANVGWACDYKDVLKTTPAEAIKAVLEKLHAKLIVGHNDPNPGAFNPEYYHNNALVGELFRKVQPEFIEVAGEKFTDAMDHFIVEQKIDMMLVIPKKHGWLESIFRRSHTTRLAFHTHIPLLCIQALS
ncbi:MAG TPA: universal stress protein [Phnomibacter sp.]|nr:universal stress protein [Phnomibacter sp.]